MKLGFIILAHQNFNRVEQLVRHLSEQGCPVCVHIDGNVKDEAFTKFSKSVHDLENVHLAQRTACEWGRFSIVQATLDASELLLEEHPNVSNVQLISGSCLPVRPIRQLYKFMERNKKTDFIESVSVRNNYWVKGGLNEERFTLYFPFSWRKQRRLFDGFVNLQRKLKIERKLPSGVVPHIGSQWWCLTAKTLRGILNDPRRQFFDSYFSRSWIPDESYFQTLARLHTRKIESRSLTFSKFDYQGRPFTFYDDHLELLSDSNCFMGRKIWAGAEELYDVLLDSERPNQPMTKARPKEFEEVFEQADKTRCEGGEGRFNQGRFPYDRSVRNGPSGSNYTVFVGYKHLFRNFPQWLEKNKKVKPFGSVFDRRHVSHRRAGGHFDGNLPAEVKVRNRNPKGYLSNLLWFGRDQHQSFLFDFKDNSKIVETVVSDPRAQVILIRHSWMFLLAGSEASFDSILSSARRLHKMEEHVLNLFNGKTAEASLKIVDLETALEEPFRALSEATEHLNSMQTGPLMEMPEMHDIEGIENLVKKLRNRGLKLVYNQTHRGKPDEIEADIQPAKPFIVNP